MEKNNRRELKEMGGEVRRVGRDAELEEGEDTGETLDVWYKGWLMVC